MKQRANVVALLRRAQAQGICLDAVSEGGEWVFERLQVHRHEGKTRAVMKIQEGCDRFCAYCIIPSVRGPLRYMALGDVQSEAQRLASEGYKEIVITGIHLASYGRGISTDGDRRPTLMDAIKVVHDTEGIARVRLGSLEPPLITEDFAKQLARLPKLCPQFHLSMQSGSAEVLRRMGRRYDPAGYMAAVERLREAFPRCAITTDVLTGFPGETEKEAMETLRFVEDVGFARIHVFPYSRREGTRAGSMADQVPEEAKKRRAAELIGLGNQLEERFVNEMVGSQTAVLMEEQLPDGLCAGYSPEYVRVVAASRPGALANVLIERAEKDTAYGKEVDSQ